MSKRLVYRRHVIRASVAALSLFVAPLAINGIGAGSGAVFAQGSTTEHGPGAGQGASRPDTVPGGTYRTDTSDSTTDRGGPYKPDTTGSGRTTEHGPGAGGGEGAGQGSGPGAGQGAGRPDTVPAGKY